MTDAALTLKPAGLVERLGMGGFRSLLRTGLSPKGKQIISSLIASDAAGAVIRLLSGKTIRHRGTRVRIDHPRVTNEMVGGLFWKIYERAEADQIIQHMPRDRDVVELGASSGVNTVLIARLLQPGQRVVAVEADPELSALAWDNCRVNGCQDRVSMISAALHYGADAVAFSRGPTPVDGRLSSVANAGENAIEVPACTLRGLMGEHRLDHFTLVMDIEGAEWELIQRPKELARCDFILAELHEVDIDGRTISVEMMLNGLQAQGFELVDRYGVCVALRRDEPWRAAAAS